MKGKKGGREERTREVVHRCLGRTCAPVALRARDPIPPQLHQALGRNVPEDGECPADLLSAIDQYAL